LKSLNNQSFASWNGGVVMPYAAFDRFEPGGI